MLNTQVYSLPYVLLLRLYKTRSFFEQMVSNTIKYLTNYNILQHIQHALTYLCTLIIYYVQQARVSVCLEQVLPPCNKVCRTSMADTDKVLDIAMYGVVDMEVGLSRMGVWG